MISNNNLSTSLFENWLKSIFFLANSQLRGEEKEEKTRKFILHSSVGISRIKFHPMKRMRDAQPAELSRPYYFELVQPGTFHGLSESDRAEKTRDPSNSFLVYVLPLLTNLISAITGI